jgi:hypothetical protein
MAKTAGMGDNCYIGGYDLSGDVGSLSRIGGGPSPLEVTGINVSAPERLGGKRDGAIEFSSWFNPGALAAHVALSPLPTANVIASYFRGTAIGNPAASVVAKQINYDGNRGEDGSLAFSVQALANGFGLEWGDQLTAGKRTDTGATAGTAFDSGAATTNFGLQAYLQVFSFVGTDVTVKIQESSDNAGDAYADVVGGGFTQITGGAPLTQRIATATNLAVERYLKVTTVTTGGFTSLVFSVMCVRNLAVPTF